MGDFYEYLIKIRRSYKNKFGVTTTPIIVYMFQSTPATKKIRRQPQFYLDAIPKASTIMFMYTIIGKQLVIYSQPPPPGK